MSDTDDRARPNDYEIFANVSDVMEQLRAARRLAVDDPDPEVRKRASWFAKDVTWVIDMITRSERDCVPPARPSALAMSSARPARRLSPR